MSESTELLSRINSIVSSQKEKSSALSERFNIFQVLNITTDEVRLHSKFLAELLDPKGSHEKGSIFLNRFLELTGSTGLFNPDLVNVTVEYQIGPVTLTTGGRIDILIQDSNENSIIIENKIYAGDQENQLLRYFNFAKTLEKRGAQFKLLYLTLFEKNASDYSLGEDLKHEDYHKISYQETIINWLEDCSLMVDNTPKLAVAITHYLQLIKQLTHQDISMETKEEIISVIIDNSQNFSSAENVALNLLSAKKVLLKNVGVSLVEKLNESPQVKDVIISEDFGSQYQGIEIYIENAKDALNRPAHIRLSFLSNASSCYFEIHPGLQNGKAVQKNKEKWKQYVDTLNEHFGRNKGKIRNTELHWEGEWVMDYYLLENRFNDIINNKDAVVKDVMIDLKIIINHFVNVQSSNL